MPLSPPSVGARHAVTVFLALLTLPSAHALLRFNDGKDQIYVTAFVGAGYDSNVFARADGATDGPGRDDSSDLIISGGAGIEYARKAGLIGVNASLNWNFGRFDNYSGEDFLNPSMSLEFSKGTGRTTGGVQLNARRESRADETVGLRTDSWNYGINFNYRYPVIERYSIAGNIGWDRIDYLDDGVTFVDLDTYTIGTDLFYSWRSDRDLLAGYRYRFSDSASTSRSTDHSVYVGVTGRIVSKLSGSARVGWSFRSSEYPASTRYAATSRTISEDDSDGLYVSLSSTWPATRKITFTVSGTQDFSTTSTNFQTETTSVDLTGNFSHTVKLSSTLNVGAGWTDYLSGFVNNDPVYTPGFNGEDRSDHYFTVGAGVSYALTSHVTLAVNYSYYRNWSNLSDYEFTRHSVGVTLSTRW